MPPLNTLSAIYALYETWARAYVFACRKGCATCCTQSVTVTTLEGELIHEYLTRRRPDLLPRLATLPADSPSPGATTNQFAAACLRGEDIAETPGCWDLTPCVFLQEGSCTIYPVRSFMCRSFGSRIRCDEQGEAEVEPLFLTLNTIIMQCIEHLDQGRPWGNLNTILRRIAAGNKEKEERDHAAGLVAQPIPGFLLLPEEEAALQEKLQTLLRLLNAERQPGEQEIQ
jgi:Fe-S-cluster containining protein